ncbi:MAG TPA: hypothetical protein VMV86_01125 [Methanosarcinales archaeon]|nr:hypothetical protein [Methanosarcinales archaeon]
MTNKQLAYELLRLAKAIVSADTFKCPSCGTKVLKQTGYCVKCKKKVKEASKSISAGDPLQDAIDAYSEGSKSSLRYRGPYVNGAACAKIIVNAVPGGYNDFDSEDVAMFVKSHGGYKYSFGREYSPVLYIKGIKTYDDVIKMKNEVIRKLKADEVSLNKGGSIVWAEWSRSDEDLRAIEDEIPKLTLRVWWD